jgi:hypothetical protein
LQTDFQSLRPEMQKRFFDTLEHFRPVALREYVADQNADPPRVDKRVYEIDIRDDLNTINMIILFYETFWDPSLDQV